MRVHDIYECRATGLEAQVHESSWVQWVCENLSRGPRYPKDLRIPWRCQSRVQFLETIRWIKTSLYGRRVSRRFIQSNSAHHRCEEGEIVPTDIEIRAARERSTAPASRIGGHAHTDMR